MTQELRNRIAEIVMISALLVAAWYVLAAPTHTRVAESRELLAQLEAEAARFESARQTPPDQARALERRIDHYLEMSAPQEDLERHEHVLSLARNHALDVSRINPARGVEPISFGPIRLGARRVHIEVSGAFDDACAFLSDLTCEAPMTVIENFSIAPHTGEDADTVGLSVWIRSGGITVDRANLTEATP